MDYLKITPVTNDLLISIYGTAPTAPEGMTFSELQIRNGGEFPEHDSGELAGVNYIPAPRPDDLPYYEPDPPSATQLQFMITHAGTAVTSGVVIESRSIQTLALICEVTP